MRNAWKVSKYWVFSSPYFPVFGNVSAMKSSEIRAKPDEKKGGSDRNNCMWWQSRLTKKLSESLLTFTMEIFVIIINDLKLLTILPKSSISVMAWVLYPPLWFNGSMVLKKIWNTGLKNFVFWIISFEFAYNLLNSWILLLSWVSRFFSFFFFFFA